MKMNVAVLAALLTLASAGGAFAFQELPSLELSPYVGFLKYDSAFEYDNSLAYGIRADMRFIPYLGLQFHYARSANKEGMGGFPFGADDYVSRTQLNLTYDLLPMSGFFVHLYTGVGSFNRYTAEDYRTSNSVQLGLGARRNLKGDFYLRGDLGWTGAWIQDSESESVFSESTLTHNMDISISLSYLLDN
jgi:hypothetical protein